MRLVMAKRGGWEVGTTKRGKGMKIMAIVDFAMDRRSRSVIALTTAQRLWQSAADRAKLPVATERASAGWRRYSRSRTADELKGNADQARKVESQGAMSHSNWSSRPRQMLREILRLISATAAAAITSAGISNRRPCVQEQPTGGV
jgi:hypothetical protein